MYYYHTRLKYSIINLFQSGMIQCAQEKRVNDDMELVVTVISTINLSWMQHTSKVFKEWEQG